MTNAERKARRSESARRAAGRRRQAKEEARDNRAEQARADELAHQVETAEERARRAELAEAKRRENLRAVLAEAQRIRRESDLYRHAQVNRWSHHPGRWTAEQIAAARRFLAGFIRPDGTPDPHPVRRKGRWRL